MNTVAMLIPYLSLFSLLIFLLSLYGKVSPKFTLSLILATAFSIYLSISLYNYSTKKITKNVPANFIPNLNHQAKKLEKPDGIIPQKLTYQITGFWKWDNYFKQVLSTEFNWQEVKTAKHIIAINHSKNLEQDASGKVLQYVYNKGNLEISLNNNLCCCEDIGISEKISANSMPDANTMLQQKISALVKQHETAILKKLYQCTKKIKH